MPIPKVIAGFVFNVALYALLLFVPAGTLHWWRAWVFLAVTSRCDARGHLEHFA